MIKEENNSGTGKSAEIPEEISGWNWGAFLLTPIWGVCNNSFVALLVFLPFVNMIMPFVLGLRGNEWAWQNRKWKSVEHFKQVQKKWTKAGLIVVFLVFPILFAGFATLISSIMKGDAFEMALSEIASNTEVISQLGSPIKAGFFVTGNISTSGPQGVANLSFSVSGDQDSASAVVYAIKEMGKWKLVEVIVYDVDDDWNTSVVTQE